MLRVRIRSCSVVGGPCVTLITEEQETEVSAPAPLVCKG